MSVLVLSLEDLSLYRLQCITRHRIQGRIHHYSSVGTKNIKKCMWSKFVVHETSKKCIYLKKKEKKKIGGTKHSFALTKPNISKE